MRVTTLTKALLVAIATALPLDEDITTPEGQNLSSIAIATQLAPDLAVLDLMAKKDCTLPEERTGQAVDKPGGKEVCLAGLVDIPLFMAIQYLCYNVEQPCYKVYVNTRNRKGYFCHLIPKGIVCNNPRHEPDIRQPAYCGKMTVRRYYEMIIDRRPGCETLEPYPGQH